MFRIIALFSAIFMITQLAAHEWQMNRADSHAPINVMGDHNHNIGEVMFSYRYMSMTMDGNRSDQSSVSVSDVLTDFMVAPLDMTMDMHMLGSMYAPSDKLTLMAMVPVITSVR